MKKEFVIFGAGYKENSISNYLVKWLNKRNIKIKYFIDNERAKWGKQVYGIDIYNPLKLKEENKNDIMIIIASGYTEEISLQLEELGFTLKENFIRIYDWEELRKDFIKYKTENSIYKSKNGEYTIKTIELELSSACNMQCIYCPFHSILLSNKDKVKSKLMSEEIFLKILEEMKAINTIEEIIICGAGEFLLNPNWYNFVKRLKEIKTLEKIILRTNGKLLNEENCEKIKALDFKYIDMVVSIDGYTQNENSEYRINSDYNIIRDNLLYLLNIVDEKIKITINNVKIPNKLNLGKESELKLPEFIKTDFNNVESSGTFAVSYKMFEEQLIEHGLEIYEKINENLFTCTLPFNFISIDVDGNVKLCGCGNSNKTINYGTILKNWNSEEFNEMRDLFLEGKNPEICKECIYNVELSPYKIICK